LACSFVSRSLLPQSSVALFDLGSVSPLPCCFGGGRALLFGSMLSNGLGRSSVLHLGGMLTCSLGSGSVLHFCGMLTRSLVGGSPLLGDKSSAVVRRLLH
jgi:hypothetical protein